LVSLHFQRDPARSSAEIPGLEAESVSVNMGVACVDMVRAKSSPSRIESRSMGRAYVPFRAKRFSSRKFVAQRLRIRKALGSMTRITLHVTTRQVERLRALRIFFRENQAFEKTGAGEACLSLRLHWKDCHACPQTGQGWSTRHPSVLAPHCAPPAHVRTLRIAPRYAFGGHFRSGLPLERANRWSFETGGKERGRPRAGPFPDYDAGGLYVSG